VLDIGTSSKKKIHIFHLQKGFYCSNFFSLTKYISKDVWLCTEAFILIYLWLPPTLSISRPRKGKKRGRVQITLIIMIIFLLKGLAKLGNIVAETMFLVMFPGVAKLGNICFGRKLCVREAKMFLIPGKKISAQKNFRNTCFPRG